MKRALERVVVEAAAKVNLGWRVGALRDDGFHDVDGTIQTISLCDRLTIERAEDMRLSVPGRGDLEGPDNLVWVAASRLRRAMRSEPPPVRITVDKRIPVAAGLGGGSADAAATLVGLDALWSARMSARQLVRIGAEVGSDVAPLLVGGRVLVSGRGEDVRRVGDGTESSFVLGVCREPISAADAYRTFDRIGGGEPRGPYHNDLEAAACELLPGLRERVDAMREAAGEAFVSGSGPTVVAVTSEPEAVAARVRGVFDEVLVARPQDWGVRVHLGS